MATEKLSSQRPAFFLTVAARMADHRQRMAEQIRKERERRGWRREDLAQKTGASYRQIERWETGKARPQMAYRLALAEAFDMELEVLFPDMEAEEQALRDQLDRVETELATMRVELGEVLARLEDLPQTIARTLGIAPLKNPNRKAK